MGGKIKMKIEKIASMMLVLMLVFITMPLVFADDNNETDDDNETEVENETEVDNETQEEISIMGISYGAEIRLLQLEKAISKNIARGNAVIAAYKNVSQDTSELQSIVDNLTLVLEQVKSTDPRSDTAVKDFVAYKKSAITLAHDFRTLSNEMKASLDQETLDALRAEFKAIKEDQKGDLKEMKERIKNRIQEKNAKELSELLGMDYEELIKQIQNGNLTKAEIKMQIREIVSNMSQEQRKELYLNAKQFNLKREIQGRDFALQTQESIKARNDLRTQEMIAKVDAKRFAKQE